jgi:transposase
MELFTLGIDLGKTTFHVVGMNQRGEVILRKRFSRLQLLHFTANLKVELIGMEACGGSHFLGRALQEQGHGVRLIPAQYVKPYVKTNKSDYIDAEAIAEAVGRPTMRFVPVKSDDQLDLQSLHRVRERWVMRRTAVVNQIRGLLLERGTTLRKGRRYVDEALPVIVAGGSAKLSGAVLVLLAELKQELEQLAEKIDRADKSVEKIARENDGNGNDRDDRQRFGISQRARFCRLVGSGSRGTLDRRQANAVEDSSAWKPVLAQAVRARSQSRYAAPD